MSSFTPSSGRDSEAAACLCEWRGERRAGAHADCPIHGIPTLGHDIDSLLFDGEEWTVICTCGWEAWGRPDEWYAREAFDDHVHDDLSARLRKLHDTRKAVTL